MKKDNKLSDFDKEVKRRIDRGNMRFEARTLIAIMLIIMLLAMYGLYELILLILQ